MKAIKRMLAPVKFAAIVAAAMVAAGCQSSSPVSGAQPGAGASAASPVQTKASQAAMTPQQALAELRAGNARFAAGEPRARSFPAEVRATAAGQYPFAVVLSCLDSRQPVEIVFD